MRVNDRVFFCTSGSNFCPIDQRHTITLEQINSDAKKAVISVVLLIASKPREYTLLLNKPLEIDVDGDGMSDIRITLKRLSASEVEINFVSLRHRNPGLLSLLGVGG